MDNQEYYNLPHWINYSFYNPVHPWNQFRFQPKINLSDHLVLTKPNPFIQYRNYQLLL